MKLPYKTSKDYKKLKELLDNGYRIIVTFFDDEVAEMRKGNNSWPGWDYGARYAIDGPEHARIIYGDTQDEFSNQCYCYAVNFIEPTEEEQ